MNSQLSSLSLYQLVDVLKLWNKILSRTLKENPNAKNSIRILRKKIQETETCIINMLLEEGTHKKIKDMRL